MSTETKVGQGYTPEGNLHHLTSEGAFSVIAELQESNRVLLEALRELVSDAEGYLYFAGLDNLRSLRKSVAKAKEIAAANGEES